MSRSGDFHGDDRQTDRQTDYFILAHARGVIILYYDNFYCTENGAASVSTKQPSEQPSSVEDTDSNISDTTRGDEGQSIIIMLYVYM